MTSRRDDPLPNITLEKCLILQDHIYHCVLWKLMEQVCDSDREKVNNESIEADEERGEYHQRLSTAIWTCLLCAIRKSWKRSSRSQR